MTMKTLLVIFGLICFFVINEATNDAVLKSKHDCEWTELLPDYCKSGKYEDQDLGTFEQGSHTIWCHQVSLPQPVAKDNAQFWVSSPGPNKFTNLTIDYEDIIEGVKTLSIDTSRELWILIHGFGCSWPKPWMFEMQEALLGKGHNVILVRWSGNGVDSGGSCAPHYFQAAANTRVMGAVVARLVNLLMAETPPKADVSKLTLLGFSLGAHVAGFAGARLPGLKKIVGMDPAGPLFGFCNSATRLNSSNAEFVQAIHCNAEEICCGTLQQMGHIDFYANGGKFQPGCEFEVHQLLHFNPGCSHKRCPYLFTTSILNSNDEATDCRYKSYPTSTLCTKPTVTGPTDWKNGDCFRDCDPKLGCAIPGYEMTNETPFSGVHYFGTLENDDLRDGYCGRTYKLTMTAGSDCGGSVFSCSLTAQLNGKGFKSFTETLVDDSKIKTDETSSHIMMFEWSTPDGSIALPESVNLCFSTHWIETHHFAVRSIQVVRDDGRLFESAAEAEVERDSCLETPLVDTGKYIPSPAF